MIAQTQTNTHTHTAHFSDRQPSEQTARLADMQGPGQRALFRVHDCMQRRTKRLSLRQSASQLIRAPPATSAGQSDRHTGPDHQPPVHAISRLLSAL